MNEISSLNNRILKDAAALADKKHRDRSGSYLIEGPNFVRDAVLYGGRLRFIFIRAGALSSKLEQIAQLAEDCGSAVYLLTDECFSRLSDVGNSQGIAAVADKRLYSEDAFFRAASERCILVLDRIQDPGNMGTMLRSAEALDIGGVMLLKGCADVYAPKVVRAAAGSLMRMPVITAESPQQALDMLRAHGKRPYAAVMEAELSCMEAELAEDAAIIIGNEGSGICEELISSSIPLKIPMAGNIESLNAGLAAGIIMYESYRQKLALKQ